MVKKWMMLGAVVSLMFVGGVSFADGMPGEPAVMQPVEKLARGISNVAFGWLEIPMKVYDVNTVRGGIAGITYGPLKGIAYFLAREVVGVVEIVTFPVPLPNCPQDPNDFGAGYGPIMRPAWIVDPAHNAFNFFYDDSAIVSTPY